MAWQGAPEDAGQVLAQDCPLLLKETEGPRQERPSHPGSVEGILWAE